MSFAFERLKIQEIILIQTTSFVDNRGVFKETYKLSEFSAAGISGTFVQENYSRSKRGVIRGLHYQKHPRAQGKLIAVSSGRIFDVAVDIRRGSPTYRQWVGMDLSSDNDFMLFVPPGFAHGFCVLSEEAIVVYKVTAEYDPELERGIIWRDPDIAVNWPLVKAIVSPKDANLPFLRDADNNFDF